MRINIVGIVTLGLILYGCSNSVVTNIVPFQETERDIEYSEETFSPTPIIITEINKTETPTITSTIYATNTNTPVRGEIAIKVLKTYVSSLENVNKIRLIYRPDHEWIFIPEELPEDKEYIIEITNMNEIDTIMEGFKLATIYYDFWSMCGFYFRIDFLRKSDELKEEQYIGTLFLGRDDDRSFTMKDVHAIGEMANDYLYRNYMRVPKYWATTTK